MSVSLASSSLFLAIFCNSSLNSTDLLVGARKFGEAAICACTSFESAVSM